MNLRSKLSLFPYRNEVEIVEMENIGHQISSYHQTRHLLPRISFPTPSEHCLSDRKRKLPSDNEFLVFPVHILPGVIYPRPLKIAKKSGEENVDNGTNSFPINFCPITSDMIPCNWTKSCVKLSAFLLAKKLFL